MVASTLDFAYETQKYGIFWAQHRGKKFLDFLANNEVFVFVLICRERLEDSASRLQRYDSTRDVVSSWLVDLIHGIRCTLLTSGLFG